MTTPHTHQVLGVQSSPPIISSDTDGAHYHEVNGSRLEDTFDRFRTHHHGVPGVGNGLKYCSPVTKES